MKLSYTSLFIVIILALGFFNLSVLIRNPIGVYFYAFPMSFLLPGFLLSLILRIHADSIYEKCIYIVGLGVSFLLFLGLGINVTLPYLGITQPLSQLNLLPGYSIAIAVLALYILLRKTTVTLSTQIIRLEKISVLMAFLPLLFPVLSIFGANRITNNLPNTLTLFMLTFITVYIVALLSFPRRLQTYVYIAAVYSIGLAILLMLSARNTLIAGSDIMTEYMMFQTTFQKGQWVVNSIKHAYYACLSITLFPTFIAKLLDVEPLIVFKFLFQILTAFLPVTVLLFAKRFFTNTYSFIGSLFFISFPIYINALPMHMRQEISFFFFALLVFSIFTNKVNSPGNKAMIFLFALGMIVSHYSTSYVAIILFSSIYGYSLILKLIHRITKTTHAVSNLSFLLVMFLGVVTLFWYSDLNSNSSNILGYISNSFRRLHTIFSDDNRKEQTSPFDQFNLSYTPKDRNVIFQDYLDSFANKNRSSGYYNPSTYADYIPTIVSSEFIPAKIPIKISNQINFLAEIVKKIFKLIIIIGAIVMLVNVRKKHFHIDVVASTLGGLTVLLIFMIVPFFTLDYDLLRTFQQLLVLLVVPLLFPFAFITKKLIQKILFISASSLSIAYFLIYTGFLSQLMGNTYPTIQFNNFGDGFNNYYLLETEKASSQWFSKNKEQSGITVYTDGYANFKYIASSYKFLYPNTDIHPANMFIQSYVFLSYPNEVKRISYKNIAGITISYLYPYDFLTQNKNKIYSNKSSTIFR